MSPAARAAAPAGSLVLGPDADLALLAAIALESENASFRRPSRSAAASTRSTIRDRARAVSVRLNLLRDSFSHRTEED